MVVKYCNNRYRGDIVSMKSIGILYIATGPYITFWEAFYKSFENFFLKNTEKHYYIFTDKSEFYGSDNPRVHKTYQKFQPWPIPTLLKFQTFLEIKDELLKHDYLYQSNGPVICVKEVKEEDFLPREDCGEKMMFTLHPGYYNKKNMYFPYERRRESLAYVPYNCGKEYVFGAMNGGVASDYIEFAEMLNERIVDDLNRGIIAEWHDESHINCMLTKMNNYRLLPMSYAYPPSFDVPAEKIVVCLDKRNNPVLESIKDKKVFEFKGRKRTSLLRKIKNRILPLCYVHDKILKRDIYIAL